MRFKLIVSDDADIDIEQAMDYYESRQSGLGARLVLSIKACLKLIIKNPFAFVTIYHSIRKANIKKFPYSLFYLIDEEAKLVTIIAVIHGHRSEELWKQRIDDILSD